MEHSPHGYPHSILLYLLFHSVCPAITFPHHCKRLIIFSTCFMFLYFKIFSLVFTAAAPKSLQSCPTLCDPTDGSPPGSPIPGILQAKNTGVGCHFLLQCMKVKSESEVAQSCPTLSDPMDCSPPGSSIHGTLQARVLEWGAIAFSLVLTTVHKTNKNMFFCQLKKKMTF